MTKIGDIFPDLVTRLADGREFRTKRAMPSIYDTVEKNDNLSDLDIANEKLDYLDPTSSDPNFDDAYTPYLDSDSSYSRDSGVNGHDEALLLDTIGSNGLKLMEIMRDSGSGPEYDKSVEALLNSADTQQKMDNLQKAMNNFNIIRLE